MLLIFNFPFQGFNVLNSFPLKDKNFVQQLNDGTVLFKDSTTTALPTDVKSRIIAPNPIRREFVELLRSSDGSFIITLKMKPKAYHKGSIIWLEGRKIG